MTLDEAALQYAERGLPVFPVRGKKPLTRHGLKDATTDPGIIRDWWSRWPDANVAIPTGLMSGLIVLDVDSRHSGEASLEALEQVHGALPATLKARTGGGGCHIFFTRSDGRVIRNSAGKLGPGLDVRGEGGYVVIPPSLHPSGNQYQWANKSHPAPLPEWLAAKLGESELKTEAPNDSQGKIPEGQRNCHLTSLAGTMRQRGMTLGAISAALLEENKLRCDPPLLEDEVRAIAKSISGYPPALQWEMERQIESLSMLDRVAYDRVREQKAKELGIRVGTLDAEVQARRTTHGTEPSGQGQLIFLSDPQPWESEVSGEALLKELTEVFLAYLTMPKGTAETLALWIIFTYAHDAFQISPLLAATSPEKGCGKSTLLTLVAALARKPLSLSNITSSALFRVVEMCIPTLLIDEADTFIPENEELRGVINSGWLRSQAQVIRSVGDDHEPRLFSTWGPKAIAIIGNLPGTLADRSIEVRMCRQTPEEARAKRKLRPERLIRELEYLRRKTWRWVQDNVEVLGRSDPEVPEGFANRLADNWRPLFAIADLAGGEWPCRAREVAAMLSGTRADQPFAIMLLEDLRCLFTEQEADRLSSAAIVEALGGMEDRPWSEYSHDKPITKYALSKILARFGVYPDSVRIGDKTLKGYLRQDLEEPFRRFLSPTPFQGGTTEQAASDATSMHYQGGTRDTAVPSQKAQNPSPDGPCSVVPASAPPEGGKRILEFEI